MDSLSSNFNAAARTIHKARSAVVGSISTAARNTQKVMKDREGLSSICEMALGFSMMGSRPPYIPALWCDIPCEWLRLRDIVALPDHINYFTSPEVSHDVTNGHHAKVYSKAFFFIGDLSALLLACRDWLEILDTAKIANVVGTFSTNHIGAFTMKLAPLFDLNRLYFGGTVVAFVLVAAHSLVVIDDSALSAEDCHRLWVELSEATLQIGLRTITFFLSPHLIVSVVALRALGSLYVAAAGVGVWKSLL